MDRRQAFDLAYLACAALFIFGLMQLASPRTAVRGNQLAAAAMGVIIAVTLWDSGAAQPGLDHRRRRGRRRDRRLLGAGREDDGDAADGRPVQRRRRRRSRPDRVQRVPHRRPGQHQPAHKRRRLDPVLGHRRLRQLRRLDGRLRQAAGADHRKPGDHAGPEVRQRRPLPGRARPRSVAVRGQPERGSAGGDDGAGAGAGRDHGDGDRRRRHAGRDLPAELVHRPGRGRHRLRAEQRRADHRRNPGGCVRHAADPDDGPGDEPLDRERGVRRVRHRRRGGGGGGRRPTARCGRPAPTTSP